jgi:thioredoxin reductase
MRSRFFSNAPWAFHYLPEGLRIRLVKTTLGPSGGYFIRDLVVGKVTTHLSQAVEKAEVQGNLVNLHLRAHDGSTKQIQCDHVIAATGYRVDLNRLSFLAEDIRAQIRTAGGAPILSSGFESSVPGLYFVGLAAANSFGPVMRFAFGAGFAARKVTQSLKKAMALSPATVPAVQLAVKSE